MYDDDFFSNLLNSYTSTTTETEQQQSQTETTSYSPQQTYTNPYSSVQDDDDYSIRPNYEEQQSYNSTGSNYGVSEESQSEPQTYTVRQMDTPVIRKEAPAVNLIKSRSKIELHARMKIAITMFSVIVATLLFAIVWNFVSASKMRATFASKEYEIASLQADIKAMQSSYIELSDDEKLKADAENAGYVEQSDSNTIYVDFEEYFKASEKEVSSNWFNDVCDFLSELFG